MPAREQGWRVIEILVDDQPRVRAPAVRISARDVGGRPTYSHTLGIDVDGEFQPRAHIPDREASVYAALLDLAVEKVAALKVRVQTSAPEVIRRRRPTMRAERAERAETLPPR